MQFYFLETEKLEQSRWDTNYWRPDLLVLVEQIDRFKLEIKRLGDISEISNGKAGSRFFTEEKDVQYISISNLLKTGLNLYRKPKFIKENGPNDPQRSKVENGDILLPISGSGSIEKSTLVQDFVGKANISQDIAKIRLNEPINYSTILFLQSKWGVAQILRNESGTGITHLSLEDIKNFKIPMFPKDIEDWAKDSWINLNDLHKDYIKKPNAEKKRNLEKERVKIIEAFERKCNFYIKK